MKWKENGGDDRFTVEDLSATDVQNVEFSGDKGNDTLNGAKTSTVIEADGGAGDDFVSWSAPPNDTLGGGLRK
ncbi:MAG: hypothetical protein HC825_01195 [Oscillatoriales cyanobacterium RM1_1_9]|nr:hypothetical protein [Oscillatoriales cyanobacterium RM1_1_9]